MITNVLTIYERLYEASNNIKGETIDYNRGFQDAVYMLSHALKKYEHINLHIENKRLSYDLFVAHLALDGKYDDRATLQRQLSETKEELKNLKAKKIVVKGSAIDFNRFVFEFKGNEMSFFINANDETVALLWKEASEHALQYKIKSNSDFKCRVMEYYRKHGFKLHAK